MLSQGRQAELLLVGRRQRQAHRRKSRPTGANRLTVERFPVLVPSLTGANKLTVGSLVRLGPPARRREISSFRTPFYGGQAAQKALPVPCMQDGGIQSSSTTASASFRSPLRRREEESLSTMAPAHVDDVEGVGECAELDSCLRVQPRGYSRGSHHTQKM